MTRGPYAGEVERWQVDSQHHLLLNLKGAGRKVFHTKYKPFFLAAFLVDNYIIIFFSNRGSVTTESIQVEGRVFVQEFNQVKDELYHAPVLSF